MSDTSPPASRRILVVDDNAINRRLAMAFVKRLGFVTEEVEDGASALAKLRADPRFNGLHIIAYTAHALPEEKQRLIDAGFDDLLIKPISLKAVELALANFLPA